ncbi:thioredoxin domain-containing protein [Desulfogranum mediterraneum]|uniref:thioredoxin domain-containing protein n=1 Tax=Desulfogranum mediterraneum TaxID=160661 RepID=UPI00040C4ACC|nr:thioredoxin domain-containing protein [Desulfogranum mediterraneum]
MLRILFLCIPLLFSQTLYGAEAAKVQRTGNLNWSEITSWKIQAKPLAMVQSLDKKRTFILGNDAKVHIYTITGKKLGALPVSPDIIDIDIAPRGEAIYLLNGTEQSFTAIDISFTQEIDTSTAPLLGDPEAPLTLVEFSDFECPYCSKVKPILDKLLKANPGKIKIAFKHLPLRMHAQAKPAARAAIAAQQQGKFWEMHDQLFATKKISSQSISESAAKIGLDMETFNRDLNSAATEQQLARDMYDAQKAEVSGTPTLFLNGILVKSRSLEAMQAMIDKALQQDGNQ